MDKHTEGADDYLEEARAKSKMFYIQTTKDAMKAACDMADEAKMAAVEALHRLDQYAESGIRELGMQAVESAGHAAEKAAQAARAAQEASEATKLAVFEQDPE